MLVPPGSRPPAFESCVPLSSVQLPSTGRFVPGVGEGHAAMARAQPPPWVSQSPARPPGAHLQTVPAASAADQARTQQPPRPSCPASSGSGPGVPLECGYRLCTAPNGSLCVPAGATSTGGPGPMVEPVASGGHTGSGAILRIWTGCSNATQWGKDRLFSQWCWTPNTRMQRKSSHTRM